MAVGSLPCTLAVADSEYSVIRVVLPTPERVPPLILRAMTNGRSVRSAALLVASTAGSSRDPGRLDGGGRPWVSLSSHIRPPRRRTLTQRELLLLAVFAAANMEARHMGVGPAESTTPGLGTC
jgi:hypothetical protein